jgi:hypothetical protein
VEHWKKFFSEHKSYLKVGRVNHVPIDPASPLPVHCEPKKEAEQKARWGAGPPPSVKLAAGTGVGEEKAAGHETEPGGAAHEEL